MIETFLKELQEKGWKQREIAEKMALAQGYVSRLCNGANCSIETAVRFADAFEVSVDEVLGRRPAEKVLNRKQTILLELVDKDEELLDEAIKRASEVEQLKRMRGKGRGERAA